MMKLRKGDKVLIIAGQDKGKQGTISKILTKSERVILDGEGLGKVKKHMKPSQINRMAASWTSGRSMCRT